MASTWNIKHFSNDVRAKMDETMEENGEKEKSIDTSSMDILDHLDPDVNIEGSIVEDETDCGDEEENEESRTGIDDSTMAFLEETEELETPSYKWANR